MSDAALPTLLVTDDDEAFRTALGAALGRRGFAVTLAADADEAEKLARAQVFEYALVDVRMPGVGGIELVERLRAIDEGTRIVVLTGYGNIANAVAAMRAGAADYLTKPVEASTCERALLGRASMGSETARNPDAVGGSDAAPEDLPSLERVEFEYLMRVLADSGGNVSEAARKLRMHRRSLQRKIARHPPRR